MPNYFIAIVFASLWLKTGGWQAVPEG